ncbi:MAG TPA: type II toxin-antitoxin system VapC family toxin [Caulobacteraceae bacterium]
MIVLDTNVVSELMRPVPSDAVVRWVSKQPAARLFTTTVTQAEILFGIALLSDGRRRDALAIAAEQMFAEDFLDRILPFDQAAAQAFAPIAASRRQDGRPIASFDAQIAAITLSRDAALATRNISDFEGCGLVLNNPWE